jgi:CheY-like chemotaxis protein
MLSLTDSGSGMDAETLSHLFEPFYTTKAKGKGTGLGLSTVYGIVKQGGGDIAIESEVGHGTAVRIYLPVADEPAKSGPETAPRPSSRSGTETILLVEDEPEVRRLANEMLTRQGYKVLEASSGAEALHVWREHGGVIDLLLTDVVMPQMSGPELAATLKALSPGLKVMYMSGYTDDVIAQQGVLDTETAFLRKPFTLDSLARILHAVLDEEDTDDRRPA